VNTRKYPRTLEQAFGPYAGGPLVGPDEPQGRQFGALEVVVAVGYAIALAGLVALVLLDLLPGGAP